MRPQQVAQTSPLGSGTRRQAAAECGIQKRPVQRDCAARECRKLRGEAAFTPSSVGRKGIGAPTVAERTVP